MVRGSLDEIVSSPPRGNANVASTTTTGRAPPASNPSLARTDDGASATPSSSTRSGAIANAVSDSRSASNLSDCGWLAARATTCSVVAPVPVA